MAELEHREASNIVLLYEAPEDMTADQLLRYSIAENAETPYKHLLVIAISEDATIIVRGANTDPAMANYLADLAKQHALDI